MAGAVPSSIVRNFSSSKVINRRLLLSMLNSTCVISDATHGRERLPSIRKKPPVWRCKPNSTSIIRKHSDAYIEGIQPRFDILKARHFDSSWNWVRQDALLMYYDIIFGRLTTVDREITVRCIALLNWADPDMLQFMQYNINQ